MMCKPKLNNRGDWFKQELHQQDSWWDKFIEWVCRVICRPTN